MMTFKAVRCFLEVIGHAMVHKSDTKSEWKLYPPRAEAPRGKAVLSEKQRQLGELASREQTPDWDSFF